MKRDNFKICVHKKTQQNLIKKDVMSWHKQIQRIQMTDVKKVPFHVGSTTCPGETHSQYTGQSPPSAVKQKRWEIYPTLHHLSLTKKPAIRETATGFPVKWLLRNEHRNSILITRHYQVLDSASDWSCCMRNLLQPIRSTTKIWVVTRHQYAISALVMASWKVGCFLRLLHHKFIGCLKN